MTHSKSAQDRHELAHALGPLSSPFLVAIAPREFESELRSEVKERVIFNEDRFFIIRGHEVPVWADQVWLNPKLIPIDSISHAVRLLKTIQRNWVLYPLHEKRRSVLISEQLPKIKFKPLTFPAELPKAPLGSFSLLDSGTLLAASECLNPMPNGEFHFNEDKSAPSRAYLKLWEALMRIGKWPKANDRVVDLGGSPGGWSAVALSLGANVLAIDRSELDPSIMKNVTFHKSDAFSFLPKPGETWDWILWDVAAKPEKVLPWVLEWTESQSVKSMICTLKFQGIADQGLCARFREIPGSQLVHLFHNKHELTWIWHQGQV